jgi:2-polyprenyl-3-methyl-5-hydroxy-6-metoxy-1,4-benzoquinol methylase
VNALSHPAGEGKTSRGILLTRLILALASKRSHYPLTCAALWSAMKLVYGDIPRDGLETYLVVDQAQIERFLASGWDYTEPRLRLLQQVSSFPLTTAGARQLVELRQQMETARDGSFDLVSAAIYEHPAYPIFQHIGQAFRNQVAERLPFVLQTIANLPVPPGRICDVGCGAGILLGDVLEQLPDAHGVGIDISCRLLQHARRVLGAWGLGERARLAQADIRCIPFGDGSYDFIMAMEVLEHLPDPAVGLHELKRVLAPEGCLVTSIPVRDQAPVHLHVFESIEEVSQMHLSAGLQIEHQQVVQVAPGVPNVLSAARKR